MNMIIMRLQDRLGSARFSLEADLPGRGITGVFGPSGAGKSTLLRFLAGLYSGDLPRPKAYLQVSGETWHDSERSIHIPTHRRPIGMVFQESHVFAHLNVLDNLTYGLRCRGKSTSLADNKPLADLIERLNLGPLLQRRVTNLSGGEVRRVALSRALATEPRLLLLDEPLTGLDERLRQDFVEVLRRTCAGLSIPVVYVSHHLDEVAALADHVLLIEAGSVIASGSARDILSAPDWAQHLPELINLIDTGLGDCERSPRRCVRSSELVVLPAQAELPAIWHLSYRTVKAAVTAVHEHGGTALLALRTSEPQSVPLVATMTCAACRAHGFSAGTQVLVSLPLGAPSLPYPAKL